MKDAQRRGLTPHIYKGTHMDKTNTLNNDASRNLIIHTFPTGRAVLRADTASSEGLTIGVYSTYEEAVAARERLLAEWRAG